MDKKKRAFCIILALAMACPVAGPGVQARKKIKLSKGKLTLTAGSSEKLRVKNTQKKVKWSSSDEKIAVVASGGKVTGKSQGTAVIKARVDKKTLKCKVRVKKNLADLLPEPSLIEAKSRDVVLSWYSDDDTVDDVGVGDYGNIRVNDIYAWEPLKASYESSDTSVVQVDGQGGYKAVGSGTARVTVTLYHFQSEIEENDGESYTCSFEVYGDASAAALSKRSVETRTNGYTAKVYLEHSPDLTFCYFSSECSNSRLDVRTTLDRGKKCISIQAYGAGEGVLTVRLNNKILYLAVLSKEVKISTDGVVLAQRGRIKLSLINKIGKTIWKSDNPRVARVSAKGKVTAKKTGVAVVYATLGGAQYGCAVSVVNKAKKKVVDTAKRIGRNWEYSQKLRMSKGYYDCSSLVWRSYHAVGFNFGNPGYAPVAADLGKWCVSHNKMIKGGLSSVNTRKRKYLPGDIMFETGESNGRYRGIYHVEMIVGYRCKSMYNGNAALSVCWAARGDDYYGSEKMLARPCR